MKRKRTRDECPVWLLLALNAFLYISSALYSPFLSAYYTQNGLSPSEIGILMCVGPVASVLIQPLWARASDASGKAKTFAALVMAGTAFSLLTYYLGHSFGGFLFSSVLLALFSTSVNPMTDAIVIRNANRCHYNFAIIRMGGTVGYAVVVLLAGIYLRRYPAAQFFLAAASYLALMGFVLIMPRQENRLPVSPPSGREESRRKPAFLRLGDIFEDKKVVYVLAFAFVFQVGASFCSAFLGVYAVELGYGQSQIGLLNCISASSEIPILLGIRKLTRKFGALHLIAASTFLMGIRLFLVSGGSLPFFMLAQAMQGVTYMVVHFGCATFIGGCVKSGKSFQGQSVLYIIQAGLASIVGNVLGGRLADLAGNRLSYRLTGGFVLLAAVIVIFALYMQERKERRSPLS